VKQTLCIKTEILLLNKEGTQLERFMYIAHRSFLVQFPKLAVCFQDVGLPGYILLGLELVQYKEAAVCNKRKTI